MQGVSAHLETVKAKGRRRHPSYCKYAKGKGKDRKCLCKKSQVYLLHCSSAANCDWYESEIQ